jgi:hypothetical protein
MPVICPERSGTIQESSKTCDCDIVVKGKDLYTGSAAYSLMKSSAAVPSEEDSHGVLVRT